MRGRHRARPRHRTAKALSTFCTATLLAGTLASPASAGGPGLPSPITVDTDDVSRTPARVWGLVDGVAYFVEEQSPTIQGDEPSLPSINPAMLNTVFGAVQDTYGTAHANVDVVLELMPSEGYNLPGGAQVIELARDVSDHLGHFEIHVPTTDEVLAEAAYLNGTVNMMLTAVKYETDQQGAKAYLGAGAIYSAMVEYGPGPGGVAMAPVNVGVLKIEETKVMTGTTGLAEIPGNDPDDPNTAQWDQPDLLPESTQGTLGVRAVSEPYVETPLPFSREFIVMPPDFPEVPADFAKDDGEQGSDGDARCKKLKNQGTWIVDRVDADYYWEPVGEVHSVPGLQARYAYSEHANTQIGVGIKEEGKAWKLSGSISVTNDSGADNDKGFKSDSFARRVNAQFWFNHNLKTWCPQGYDEEDGPWALHMSEIVPKYWTGGVAYDTRDISGRNNGNEWEKAYAEGRSMDFFAEDTFTKTKGKTFKYTFAVSAFGVGISAESVNDINHTIIVKAGTSRDKWHLFGDISAPAVAATHAVYAYY